jgi:hypothetical protein
MLDSDSDVDSIPPPTVGSNPPSGGRQAPGNSGVLETTPLSRSLDVSQRSRSAVSDSNKARVIGLMHDATAALKDVVAHYAESLHALATKPSQVQSTATKPPTDDKGVQCSFLQQRTVDEKDRVIADLQRELEVAQEVTKKLQQTVEKRRIGAEKRQKEIETLIAERQRDVEIIAKLSTSLQNEETRQEALARECSKLKRQLNSAHHNSEIAVETIKVVSADAISNLSKRLTESLEYIRLLEAATREHGIVVPFPASWASDGTASESHRSESQATDTHLRQSSAALAAALATDSSHTDSNTETALPIAPSASSEQRPGKGVAPASHHPSKPRQGPPNSRPQPAAVQPPVAAHRRNSHPEMDEVAGDSPSTLERTGSVLSTRAESIVHDDADVTGLLSTASLLKGSPSLEAFLSASVTSHGSNDKAGTTNGAPSKTKSPPSSKRSAVGGSLASDRSPRNADLGSSTSSSPPRPLTK